MAPNMAGILSNIDTTTPGILSVKLPFCAKNILKASIPARMKTKMTSAGKTFSA